jgi:hypothetical protein
MPAAALFLVVVLPVINRHKQVSKESEEFFDAPNGMDVFPRECEIPRYAAAQCGGMLSDELYYQLWFDIDN